MGETRNARLQALRMPMNGVGDAESSDAVLPRSCS